MCYLSVYFIFVIDTFSNLSIIVNASRIRFKLSYETLARAIFIISDPAPVGSPTFFSVLRAPISDPTAGRTRTYRSSSDSVGEKDFDVCYEYILENEVEDIVYFARTINASYYNYSIYARTVYIIRIMIAVTRVIGSYSCTR